MMNHSIKLKVYLLSPFDHETEPYATTVENCKEAAEFQIVVDNIMLTFTDQFKTVNHEFINPYRFLGTYQSTDDRFELIVTIDPTYAESTTGHWELDHIDYANTAYSSYKDVQYAVQWDIEDMIIGS